MKNVLIIAYQFPPMGGSGVQRTAKFTKYLPGFGWTPIVLTRSDTNLPLRDESLLKDIPVQACVIHTRAYDFTQLPGFLNLPGKFFSRKVLVPDAERMWQVFTRRIAVQTMEDKKIDLIYSTSYPYSDHLMALYLKNKFPSVPWVADFRDEWTNNPYTLDNPYNPVRTFIEKGMEKKVLRNADVLITNTPVMRANFIKKNSSLEDRFFVIPNGFDSDDFHILNDEKPHNSKFTITYTGALYGRRKPDVFFKALSSLIESGQLNKNKISVNLIGNYKREHLQNLIGTYGLKGTVIIHPYMEHEECLKHMVNSDALLLIEGSGPGAEAFYTGKLFEYINTGRPILAIIPKKGAAADIIRKTSTGIVADTEDIEGSMKNILYLFEHWKSGSDCICPDWKEISRYERKSLTEELAKLFQGAVCSVNNPC